MPDAVQQGQHGRLLQLVVRTSIQIGEQLGIAPSVRQLLCRMQGLQRPAQFGREVLVPLLAGQIADFPFGAKLGEDRPCGPRGRMGFRGPPSAAQQHRQVPRRLGLQQRPLVHGRPVDHLAQRLLGGCRLVLGREYPRPRRRDWGAGCGSPAPRRARAAPAPARRAPRGSPPGPGVPAPTACGRRRRRRSRRRGQPRPGRARALPALAT